MFFDYHQQQKEKEHERSARQAEAAERAEQSQQQLGSPETMELLTSILAAVEAQNTRIATLTEQQKKLAGFVKVMDEETTRRAERIIAATAKLEARQLWSTAAAMCLVVGAGLAGAGYGLFVSVRWVAGLVETWKGRGMPKWPHWRKR